MGLSLSLIQPRFNNSRPESNTVLTSTTGEDQVGNGALFHPEIDSGRANGEIGGELLNGPKLHDRLPGAILFVSPSSWGVL